MKNDMHNRVMYFSEFVSQISFFKERIESILNSSICINQLSDAIELFNIKRLMDANDLADAWEPGVLTKYKTITNKFPSSIIAFITKTQFTSEDLSSLDRRYLINFWELVITFDIYKNWDSEYFTELSRSTYILILLKKKKLVKKFNRALTARLIDEFEITAEVIIDFYFIKNFDNSDLSFPNDFTAEKMILVLDKYIADSANPNLNYLKALSLNNNANPSAPILPIKTKREAKRKCKSIESELTEANIPILNRSIGVQFDENQPEKFKIINNHDNFSVVFSYSLKWILEHLEFNTLLTNFKNLFGFVDSQFRIALKSSESQKSISERFLFTNYRNAFSPSDHFEFILSLEKLQMVQYYEFLEKIGIRLESLLKNYYEEGLEKLFSIRGFQLEIPSERTSYFEKCRFILPEIDILLKQFKIFVEEKIVDQELIRMDSNSIGINGVGSLIPWKYFIAAREGVAIDKALHYLFSDQCMLHYVKRIEKSYTSFYTLINSEFITKADYEDIPGIMPLLDWLLSQSFITIETNEKLRITDRARVLYDLYQNEAICFWYNSKQDQIVIKELEKDGFIECEEKLFTKAEQDMFNYLLNQQTFSDSLHLRNDYVHGSQTGTSKDDFIHMENYFVFLIIIVDITLKITEEIYLSNKLRENGETL